ncbi:MAG: hypothetical protein AABY18_05625 [Candidatus Thermoplasmatota archaeon]
MRVPSVALAVLLVAGCLSVGDKRPDYDGAEEQVNAAAEPILVQDHGDEAGHFDAAQHAGAFNLELAGYHNGMPGAGQDPNDITPGGAYNELVVTDDYVYLSRSSANGTFGGFTILSHKDLNDPAKLTYVGEFDGQHGVDLEVNADETLAFLATQRNTPQQMLGAVQATQDPQSAAARGIYVVDIADKKAPTLASFLPLPANGPHTMTYYQADDGGEYLIVCTYDLITDPATGALVGVVPVTQRVLVYEIMMAPSQLPLPVPPTLVPVAQFQITDSPPDGKMYFPHDTRVQRHPTHDGGSTTLLYVAYWDKGVRVLDFNDPASMTEIGFFTEFGPTALNNIHLTQPFEDEIDGFHVTVAQPEIQAAPDETGQVTFLDTSDPTNPTQLGYWTLPNGTSGRLGINGFDFSPHNFDLWGGKMAIGHFHAGIWVVDVSDEENLRDPKTVGYYMPSKPRDNAPAMQPAVWGVFEHDGLLWASDESTGVYVLRYTGP